MSFLNIAGYKFIALSNLKELQKILIERCGCFNLKGTILLSTEGININLAGLPENIALFKSFLQTDDRFSTMTFHESYSDFVPFNRLNVKIKKEIITMRTAETHPEIKRAPSITPHELKQWLDEKRDFVILDTRNAYEVKFGTFKNAINPDIDNFSGFAKTAEKLDPNKPIVMFCTGGIRCEKAALHLLDQGFQQVLQLENGILNYFKQIGNAHYEGECFVFDERVAVDANLAVTGTKQCKICQGPIKVDVQHICAEMITC